MSSTELTKNSSSARGLRSKCAALSMAVALSGFVVLGRSRLADLVPTAGPFFVKQWREQVAGRGIKRNSKKQPEPRDPGAQLEEMSSKALGYLEGELKLYTSSPGNFAEVTRILRALKQLSADTGKEPHGPRGRSDFAFDSMAPDPPQGEAR